jgi:putative transposase
MQISRTVLGYQPTGPQRDAPVIDLMRRLAKQHLRFGYRRIRIFLKREGHEISWARAPRLWEAAGLQLPQMRPRRCIASTRPRPVPLPRPNTVWAYDFVFNACATGQRIE